MTFTMRRSGLWTSARGYRLERTTRGHGAWMTTRWHVRYPAGWYARGSFASLAAARRHALKYERSLSPFSLYERRNAKALFAASLLN
jgi:hypothetical protein